MAKRKQNLTEAGVLVELAVKGMQEKKGEQITTLDLTGLHGVVFDNFVICHGNSPAQVEAIADSVDMEIKKATGLNPHKTEGYANAEWILLDYFDVVVHVFLKEAREFYRLESLWADGKRTDIPNIY